MRLLAIESSCDETAAAVVLAEGSEIRILSNIVASQVDVHRLYGGVVPEIASRAHVEALSRITYAALEQAGVSVGSLDGVAVTDHPGLIGALLCGVNFAKSLAVNAHLPIIPVDHIKGHIAAAYLARDAYTPPKPPFIALVVSGGHTSIYHVTSYTEHTLIGSTRDDAMGEAFDKIGRLIGIPYPAGAGFDALAREGFTETVGDTENYFAAYAKSAARRDPQLKLPSPALTDGSYDFSFSGLKTAAINLLHRFEQQAIPLPLAAFAARYTFEAVEAVATHLSAVLTAYPDCDLVLCGGVAANSHLRHRLSVLTEKLHRGFFVPPPSLCGDNAAMIAAAGYFAALKGAFGDSSLNACAADF